MKLRIGTCAYRASPTAAERVAGASRASSHNHRLGTAA